MVIKSILGTQRLGRKSDILNDSIENIYVWRTFDRAYVYNTKLSARSFETRQSEISYISRKSNWNKRYIARSEKEHFFLQKYPQSNSNFLDHKISKAATIRPWFCVLLGNFFVTRKKWPRFEKIDGIYILKEND